jgi:hypothetical protein
MCDLHAVVPQLDALRVKGVSCREGVLCREGGAFACGNWSIALTPTSAAVRGAKDVRVHSQKHNIPIEIDSKYQNITHNNDMSSISDLLVRVRQDAETMNVLRHSLENRDTVRAFVGD